MATKTDPTQAAPITVDEIAASLANKVTILPSSDTPMAVDPKNVTAQCTDSNNVIVDDDYCDESYYRSHGGYSSGGFIYIGGSSYRYNYGGSGVVGQKAVGGSYTIPKGANVTTKSGTSVQRGGFGISSGSSSSGG